MNIDHIAVYVKDLEKVKAFFETFFDAESNRLYHNSKTGLSTYIFSIGDGARLELMTKPDVDVEVPIQRLGFIHISISVGSNANVDALTLRLQNDGYEVMSGPRTTGDGYYESSILGPENMQIEITV
ncbi:MAG TPA: VOC family protein [Paludibacteraceae bacterium]|nr:VOC family protein [Paludibacteraceae bacterium]HPH63889.1 VOC family protein [Paludibacteraceae bacterium]